MSLNIIVAAFILLSGAAALYSWRTRHVRADLFRAIGMFCLAAALSAPEFGAPPQARSILLGCGVVAIAVAVSMKIKDARRA